MEGIRLATEAEVAGIKDTADLTPTSIVWAFPKGNGQADLAVMRLAVELDPVYFAEGTTDNRKAMFIWGLENMLRAQGRSEYYYNVSAKDEKFHKVLETLGAVPQSTEPEIRFKKKLI